MKHAASTCVCSALHTAAGLPRLLVYAIFYIKNKKCWRQTKIRKALCVRGNVLRALDEYIL